MEHYLIDGTQTRPDTMDLWEEWRKISIDYLRDFYTKFGGVEFDEWAFESDQVTEANRIVDEMIATGMVKLSADNLWFIHNENSGVKAVVRKSDNCTLYLSRYLFDL